MNRLKSTIKYQKKELNSSFSVGGLYLLWLLIEKNLSIGCTLTVRRAPQKGILKLIAIGEVDFYPGLGFSTEREQYLHFIENGIMSNVIALSHKGVADIHSLSDMEGKVLLTAIGSNPLYAKGYNIYIRQAHDLSVSTVIKLLDDKRADFYFYNEASIRYYLKLNYNENSKVHLCCFPASPLLLGFSKNSKYVKAIVNEPLIFFFERKFS
ncbi:MAG: transporter substrate-binding domain-containing protein [Colwellia sp.]|nr:transporter substrate-binding domain-containing protein [Colwellia sp.]